MPLGDLGRAVERAARNVISEAERLANKLKKAVDKAKKDIDKTTKNALNDIKNESKSASEKLSRSARTVSDSLNREIASAKEDIDAEATRAKNKLDQEAQKLKNDIDEEATSAKRKLDKQSSGIKGKLDGEVEKLKKNIDREATAAKQKVDRELTAFKQNIDREATALKEDLEREIQTAKDDIDEAVNAATVYLESQLQSVGDTLSEAEAKIRQGKVIDALWHVATEPFNDSKEGFLLAISQSSLLNQAAVMAVSYFGTPAAAAAYSAWLTYETTGDLEAAMKTGVIAGASAYAGKAVANMPNETITQQIKQELMKASVNAAAIAASGGTEADIQEAFMSSVSSAAAEKGQAALTQWIKTDVAPRIGVIDTASYEAPQGAELLETAKNIHKELAIFKSKYEKVLESGELLERIIEEDA